MNCFGFGILRNGVKYDYPFQASINSLNALCKDVTIALGDSEDKTNQVISKIQGIKTFSTVWGRATPQGGNVLSVQTNLALNVLRKKHPCGWGFYLQADEILSEKDFELIRTDLKKAQDQDCDAISFRYLHFWKRYDQIAVSSRWYPQEIRAIKLDSKIESFGDAQSFKNYTKIYQSDARIFHYGHVKNQETLDKKNWDFGLWWHDEKELKKAITRGKKKEKSEYLLNYLGHHPRFMNDRIPKHSSKKRKIYVLGQVGDFSEQFIQSIQASVQWVESAKELKDKIWRDCLSFKKPTLKEKIFYSKFFKTRVPHSMLSPKALPFTKEQYATLRFSEKGIPLD